CRAAVDPTSPTSDAGALGTLIVTHGEAALDLLHRVGQATAVVTTAWTRHTDLWGAAGRLTLEADGPVSGRVDLVLSPEADTVLLPADSTDGPVLLAVAADAPGVRLQRVDSMDLLRPVGVLELDGASPTVLARGEEAVAAVRRGLAAAGTALASELVGVAAHCLKAAVDYAHER